MRGTRKTKNQSDFSLAGNTPVETSYVTLNTLDGIELGAQISGAGVPDGVIVQDLDEDEGIQTSKDKPQQCQSVQSGKFHNSNIEGENANNLPQELYSK